MKAIVKRKPLQWLFLLYLGNFVSEMRPIVSGVIHNSRGANFVYE
jgi:hypothetical protein